MVLGVLEGLFKRCLFWFIILTPLWFPLVCTFPKSMLAVGCRLAKFEPNLVIDLSPVTKQCFGCYQSSLVTMTFYSTRVIGVTPSYQCTLCWDVNPELQPHGTSTCRIIHTVPITSQSEGRKQILLKWSRVYWHSTTWPGPRFVETGSVKLVSCGKRK